MNSNERRKSADRTDKTRMGQIQSHQSKNPCRSVLVGVKTMNGAGGFVHGKGQILAGDSPLPTDS
jgi:hypothetical protein